MEGKRMKPILIPLSKLPERINVMKVMTYDVEKVVQDIVHSRSVGEDGAAPDSEEITLDDVMEWIMDWVEEDFGAIDGLIFQDENGQEID